MAAFIGGSYPDADIPAASLPERTMNAAHLHLLLNHAPIFGVFFALVLLGLARYRRSEELTRLGLFTLVVSGLAAAAAMFTGEPAEHAVERLAGISEGALEAHEESAEVAAMVTYAGAALALGALVLRRRVAVAKGLTLAAVVAALVSFGLMARTANLGGQIRHPEIAGAVAADDSSPLSSRSGASGDAPDRERDDD